MYDFIIAISSIDLSILLIISCCCLISLLIVETLKYSFTIGDEKYNRIIEQINNVTNAIIDEINVNLLNSICHDLSENGEINRILYLLNFIKLIRLN